MIRIGGVPEHFNLPILLAIERGRFAELDVTPEWTYYPGGTGAMTTALAEGGLDLAILLTEGFVAAAQRGLKAHIVKVYIDSPLIWGIYTGMNSATVSLYDSAPRKYAISRFGSGSHLMAMIHAEERGEKLKEEDFVVVNSLEGAAESFSAGQAQVLYWEKLMTRPFVEEGQLRLIGEFSAPWSGFLIVASDKAMQEKSAEIYRCLQGINEASAAFRQDLYGPMELRKRFRMSPADITAWMQATVWNKDYSIRRHGLENAIAALSKISSASFVLKIEDLCDKSLEWR